MRAGAMQDLELLPEPGPEGVQLQVVDQGQLDVGGVVDPNVRRKALGVGAVDVEIATRPQELDPAGLAVTLLDADVERGRHDALEAQADEQFCVLRVVDPAHRQALAEAFVRDRQNLVGVGAMGEVDVEGEHAGEAAAETDERAPAVPLLSERHRGVAHLAPAAIPGAVVSALAWNLAAVSWVDL